MSQEKPPGTAQDSGSGPLVRFGEGPDIITIERQGALVIATVGGEVTGASLIAAVRQAIDAGILAAAAPVLVDMTTFVGTIDWGAVHKVREMEVWAPSGGQDARVGFLVRASAYGSLVNLAAALFPRARIRLFTDRAAAQAWLVSDGA